MNQPPFEEVAQSVSEQTCPLCDTPAPALTLYKRLSPLSLDADTLLGVGYKMTILEEWIASCRHCEAMFTVSDVEYLD